MFICPVLFRVVIRWRPQWCDQVLRRSLSQRRGIQARSLVHFRHGVVLRRNGETRTSRWPNLTARGQNELGYVVRDHCGTVERNRIPWALVSSSLSYLTVTYTKVPCSTLSSILIVILWNIPASNKNSVNCGIEKGVRK